VPLPVFVDAPPTGLGFDWEELVRTLLPPDVDQERIELVRLARASWTGRTPFRLPLKILAVGLKSLASLQGLRAAKWYIENTEARAYGLHLNFATETDAVAALGREAQDVVIADEQTVETVLAALGKSGRKAEMRPRLLVLLDYAPNELYAAGLKLPAGVSLLWVPLTPAADARGFIKEFVYGIIHDFPLHEAVKVAMRRFAGTLARPALLISDPLGNQSLRMSDAFAQVRDEVRLLHTQFGSSTDPQAAQNHAQTFLARLAPAITTAVAGGLAQVVTQSASVAPILASAAQLQADFNRETSGLVPLAQAEAALLDARLVSQQINKDLAALAADPVVAKEIQAQQDRRVEITLDYLDEIGLYRPLMPAQALGINERYRLCVYIGHRLENSLLVGEPPPPLDPLLPELEGQQGHTLEVAVFEKEFELLSKRVQTVYLPPLGGTRPLYFELRAPAATGPADLRIMLYHQNHLLQSFVLTTEIRETSGYRGNEQEVSVKLDYSRTERFTNLDELQERALAVSINQNQDGATHSFMLKKDEVAAAPIKLTEKLLEEKSKQFRDILENASYYKDKTGKKIRRFLAEPPPGTPPAPEAEFATVIRDLADLGRELYRLFYDSDAMKLKLLKLADSKDETIQVTRHGANYAFPWAIVYDYPLPVQIAGATRPPICTGKPLADSVPGTAPSLYKGCPHNPGRDVYCVYGFWGVRHRIEQLIARDGKRSNVANQVVRPPGRPDICLATSTGDNATQNLVTQLSQTMQGTIYELSPQDNLLDLLWTQAQRPSVLIVVGHLERKEQPGDPKGERIILFPRAKWPANQPIPEEKWLLADPISDRSFRPGRWQEQPLTLVLLMACSVGAIDLGTTNNLVKAFDAAGAAAVVGTECTTFTDLAGLFAREVTRDLWGGKIKLGEAVQAFNQRLVTSGNPLAFVFNCFGNADLTVVPPPAAAQGAGS
jgi:hypothetical protein